MICDEISPTKKPDWDNIGKIVSDALNKFAYKDDSAYSMYLIGLVVAILVAAIIHLIDRRKSENYLLIELPEYKAVSYTHLRQRPRNVRPK